MIELGFPLFIFALWTIFSVKYINRFKRYQLNDPNSKDFWNNSYIFESIPSVFPTLGIFCTALGITIGIWDFNTADIQGSIPGLLNGLRIAFIATMAGIIGLIFFQKFVAVIQKNIDDGIGYSKKEAAESGSSNQTIFILEQLKLAFNKIAISGESNTKAVISVMNSNNQLVMQKFDEFSRLLRENNTNALMEVMQNATSQFNEQMNALISQLVQDNFQELNTSVQSLNGWQKENMQQMTALSSNFKNASQLFTVSATTLKEVTENTKILTEDNGKLGKLIKELNKVLIEDEKFQRLVGKLSSTIDTYTKTTESYENITSRLNEWVITEKNFKESIEILIVKLEDFRDLNSDVWEKYRAEMRDAVGIIKEASTSLSGDLEKIDAHFYDQLNNTLTNLDNCIQRITLAKVANEQ